MTYVDGYVLPIPEGKIEDYRAMATKAGALWKEHGALSYKETVLEDKDAKEYCGNFPKLFGVKPGEVVVFAYVLFNSREHRDEVNAKVMSDPRLKGDCENMPFDPQRMAYGGFTPLVDL